MRDPSPPTHRFQAVHAGLLLIGTTGLLVAVAWRLPAVGVVAGLSIAASGGMTLAGCRITFSGALGEMLRRVLGGRQVALIQARGVAVVLLGLAVAGASLWWAQEAPLEPRPEPPGLPVGRVGGAVGRPHAGVALIAMRRAAIPCAADRGCSDTRCVAPR